MKQLVLLLLCVSLTEVLAQQIDVGLQRVHGKPVRQEQLRKVKVMDDLIAYFPHEWVEQYAGTNVTVDQVGKIQTAVGTNARFSSDQLRVLSAAAVGDRITVSVDYRRKNPVTGQPEKQALSYAFSVVADQEATHALPQEVFVKQFIAPLKSIFPEPKAGSSVVAKVKFVVLENGQISDVLLEQSSGSSASDKYILETVRSMPKWKPAQNKDGRTFRQEFVLVVNNAGC